MKKILYTISFAVVLLGMTSCNDAFLDRSPKGAITEASAFASYESSAAYVLTLYDVFNGYTFLQGPSCLINSALATSTRDLYSGLLDNYGSAWSTISNSYADQTVNIPTSSNSYSTPYVWIRNANILLDHLDDMDATDAQKKHLEAVARFFRAFSHYALLVNYGSCIYVESTVTDDSDVMTAKQNSRQYVADKIYTELDWVISYIQDDLAAANTVNSDVAKAMMSRFCLFEGSWREYHNVADESGLVTKKQLLDRCVAVSKELGEKYSTLYTGDGNDKHPGKGWGQMWTSDNLGSVPGVLLYNKYVEDVKQHRMGHYEHIASACLEMPQSTVDLYLTVDGLPIHNAAVKTYDYDGLTQSYSESAAPYDYANADPYKTFRKRDPRLWQMVVPPYKVIRESNANLWNPDEGADGKYLEYVNQFTPRGTKQSNGYLVPNFSVDFHQIESHKSLPSTNWAGNVLPNVPHTQNGAAGGPGSVDGKIGYFNTFPFQKCKSGYFVWKQVANWDKQNSTYVMDVADKPLFKIEEVLLNYAEAAFITGVFNQTVADATINRLRDRAEVGRMTVASINDSFDPDRDPTVDPVLWEIRRERLIELMGESFSFEDVRRWKKADWYVNKQQYGVWVNADDLDNVESHTGGETGLMDNATHLEASAATVAAQGGGHLYYYLDPVKANKGWLDKYYLSPIPSEEILLNPNLDQTTGW